MRLCPPLVIMKQKKYISADLRVLVNVEFGLHSFSSFISQRHIHVSIPGNFEEI
jgi:hypothetical protein